MLLKIWDEMEPSGYVFDVEVYIINRLCNNGQLENVVVIMEDCLKKGYCINGYLTCGLSYLLNGLIVVKSGHELEADMRVDLIFELIKHPMWHEALMHNT
ncbi:hypothetical protein HanRHA438_Chr00c06g0845671 [Helianthus annuus]|nr:hypothetical protein HanRHA438_Chr00c06g0845671 [Helianthus annuus]